MPPPTRPAPRPPRLGRRGVAALEFAVAAPVLVLLLAAAHDVGRALERAISLSNAVRAGAQFALAYPDQGRCVEPALCVETVVRRALPNLAPLEVEVVGPVTGFDGDACPPSSGVTCTVVTVRASSRHTSLLYPRAAALVGGTSPAAVQIRRSAKIRVS